MVNEDVFIETQTDYTNSDSHYETERNKPMPNRIHGTIQSELVYLLRSEYNKRYQFPTEVSLNLTPGATPDICIYPKRELDWRNTSAKEEEMPITTIEILSPSQSLDMMAKKIYEKYFPAGVKSAWIVVPPPYKTVYVFTPEKKYIFDEGMLKDPVTDIEVAVEKIFEGLV